MRTVLIIEKPSVRDWITKALGNTMRDDSAGTRRDLLTSSHCEDPDLPFRIDRWAQVGLDEARADQSIHPEFFGQQKQYFMQNNYHT